MAEIAIGLLRATHFLGVLVLPGTLFGSVPMLVMAIRSEDAATIRHAVAKFHAFDRIRVPVGGLLLVLSGAALNFWGPAAEPPQPLLVKQVLFYAAFVVWRFALVPRQKAMIRISTETRHPQEDEGFRHTYESWFRWGMLALALLLATMVAASILPPFI